MRVSRTQSNNSIELAKDLPGAQTSIDIPFTPPFGQLHQFSLQLSAKVDTYDKPGDRFSFNESLTYGVRTPPFSDITYNDAEGSYYLVFNTPYYNEYPEGIYKLDKNLSILDTLVDDRFRDYKNLLVSPDGKYLYLLDDFNVREISMDGLTIKSTYHTGGSFGSAIEQNFAATNNNFILYHHPAKVIVLDYAAKKILISVAPARASHISPDGQYFVNGSNVYKFDGAQFQPDRTLLQTDIRFLHFLPSGDRLFIATSEKAIVYDFVNNTAIVEYDFATNDYSAPAFDDLNMIYIVHEAGLHVLNINSGEQKVLPVYQPSGAALEGEYLFSTSGFGLKPY
jgi:hypothetical protein